MSENNAADTGGSNEGVYSDIGQSIMDDAGQSGDGFQDSRDLLGQPGFPAQLAEHLTNEAARQESSGEATKALEALKVNPEFQAALHDASHPGHAEAVQRRSQLFTQREAEQNAQRPAAEPNSDRGTGPESPAISPSAYEFDRTDAYTGQEQDPALAQEARGYLHKLGLSPAQGKQLATRWNHRAAAMERGAAPSPKAEATEARSTLEGDWGARFTERLAAAQRMLDSLPARAQQMARASGLIRDPVFIKMLYRQSRGR